MRRLGGAGVLMMGRATASGSSTNALQLGQVSLHRLERKLVAVAVTRLPLLAAPSEVIDHFPHPVGHFAPIHADSPPNVNPAEPIPPASAKAEFVPEGREAPAPIR